MKHIKLGLLLAICSTIMLTSCTRTIYIDADVKTTVVVKKVPRRNVFNNEVKFEQFDALLKAAKDFEISEDDILIKSMRIYPVSTVPTDIDYATVWVSVYLTYVKNENDIDSDVKKEQLAHCVSTFGQFRNREMLYTGTSNLARLEAMFVDQDVLPVSDRIKQVSLTFVVGFNDDIDLSTLDRMDLELVVNTEMEK